MTADPLDLAARVEAAEGPAFVLDREISDAMGHGDVLVRPYSASLDAATSLFPPGTIYRSGHSAIAPDPSMFFCDAVLPSGLDVHALAKTEPNATNEVKPNA